MRQDRTKLIIDIFLIIFLIISVILSVNFYTKIDNLAVSASSLNIFFYWAYFLLALTVLFAFIIGPLLGFIQNPKSAIKGIISIIVLLLIFGLAYSFSSTTPIELNITIKNIDFALRLADTAINSMYILGFLGILAIVVAELKELLH